jgi:CheY-like chemotaxis protein
MLMDFGSGHPHVEHLKCIEEHVISAADLTKQLLGFARSGKYEVKTTVLNELVEDIAKMFGRTKKEIRIHKQIQQDLWTVEVDRRQIEQVLLNIYVNAWQAMPSGGELTLKTKNVVMDEHAVKPYDMKPGRYVKTSITDTGVGMDEATQQRIFDPFFTTKAIDRGTGLGLASAYGIIKNHDGIIHFYSEKNKGTTFNILLPKSKKKISKEKELSKDLMKGSERVLLVDDEQMVLDVGGPMLENLGYEDTVVRGGQAAIDYYQERRDQIDIVILDMIMPDINGGETYDRLKRIDPKIKVLLSSGYSINGQAQDILNRGCNGFIQKPFNLKDLSQKVRDILDEK